MRQAGRYSLLADSPGPTNTPCYSKASSRTSILSRSFVLLRPRRRCSIRWWQGYVLRLGRSWRITDVQMVESFDTDSPILNSFLMFAFADLKKYSYHYRFAFPALVSKPAWQVESSFQPATRAVGRASRSTYSRLTSRMLMKFGHW